MNAFELYKIYIALRLHFSDVNYDFFKYKGRVNATIDSYKKLQPMEMRAFEKISSFKEPKTYMVGNFIFSNENYIRDFNEDRYLKYRKYIINGEYFFKEELNKLRLPLNSNFNIETSEEIPYIIYLINSNQISIYTACIFNKLIKWANKTKNPLITTQVNKINKSQDFFKYDDRSVKEILQKHIKENNR